MIPERLSAYRPLIPLFSEVNEWILLRKWSLSEVYRVILTSGATRIVKWCGQDMAGEAAIYEQLVNPLKIRAPYIYGYYEADLSAVIVMEDAGTYNLEQQPSPKYFMEAARELARIRETASMNLKNVPEDIICSYSVNVGDYLTLVEELLRSHLLAEHKVLLKLRNVLPGPLERLFQALPLTLVHHDYHAKNLLIQGERILPIDWSNAYLSPHLGDLYCLIKEAKAWNGVSSEDILSSFLEGADPAFPSVQLDWHVRLGGICWLLVTLRWLVYGGTQTIPGSEAWLPDLINDLDNLMKELD